MFQIVRYTSSKKEEWDHFLRESKNATFLFDRDYMDYHQDRFEDHSLLFYDEKGLYALMPANARDDKFISHEGLTYGGLIVGERATAHEVCILFEQLNDYLRREGFRSVVYKAIPWIYHRIPAEEDLYALFKVCKAQLTGRDISSVVFQPSPVKWRRDRRYGANKAIRDGIVVEKSDDFAAFWDVLIQNLQMKYGAVPVHTLEEITLLKNRFPDNILLYVARLDGEVIGGTVVYDCGKTVHAQYISATPQGKHLHAIDCIYMHLLHHGFSSKEFVDFGKSTEEHGRILNETLIYQKEGFGGRGVCYDTYQWFL